MFLVSRSESVRKDIEYFNVIPFREILRNKYVPMPKDNKNMGTIRMNKEG